MRAVRTVSAVGGGRWAAVVLCVPLVASSCGETEPAMEYPESPRGDVVDTYHGVEVADPYRWLEELDGPETRAWIEAQNALSVPALEAIPARDEVKNRLTALWDHERFTTRLDGEPFTDDDARALSEYGI